MGFTIDPYLKAQNCGYSCNHATVHHTVIAASHPYLDWISFKANGYNLDGALDDANLDAMEAFGVPLSKVVKEYLI